MNKQMIEAMAQERGWVVKYANDGTPSFFYPIYKCTSNSLDPSLPAHTHPAFIVNGQELDRVLVGVYLGSELNGAIHSLPMKVPRASLGADPLRERCVAAGPGFTGKTVAISGLLLLLARKNGWIPKGNNSYGVDYRDGTTWEADKSISLGAKRVLHGWEYEALEAHTSALENMPDLNEALWKKLKFVGGNSATRSATSLRTLTTLTGSGPLSWNLDATADGITDLNGNAAEQDWGYRIYDGELQILPNNDAMHPDADLSSGSLAWRAILPNVSDDGYTLVAPGTAGTLKWDKNGNAPRLDTTINTRMVSDEYVAASFQNLTSNIPHVPHILKELGLFPISGDTTQGFCYIKNQAGTEYFPRRGGGYGSTSSAGLGCVHASNSRSISSADYGVRSAFVEP